MQNSFHRYKLMIIAALFPCFCLISPAEAQSGRSQPIEQLSQSRLIAAEKMRGDVYRVGVDIQLKPEALTYWRQPGDAGVPPQFSFEGSENLAAAEVLYPAPTRIVEADGEAFGYRDKVVFPLRITPRDKTRPVTLKVTADYAVCDHICVPVKSHMELSLPLPAETAKDAAVAAAEMRVPLRLSPAQIAEKLTIIPAETARSETAGRNPAWHLKWTDKAPITDLFAEAPEGWYFETKKSAQADEFTLTAVEAPKNPTPGPVSVTLTMTGPDQSFEASVPLKSSPDR